MVNIFGKPLTFQQSMIMFYQHFREAVSQETGLNMVPYLTSPRPQERSLTLTPNGTSDCLQKPPSPQRRPLSGVCFI